jgi:hypothetical protein
VRKWQKVIKSSLGLALLPPDCKNSQLIIPKFQKIQLNFGKISLQFLSPDGGSIGPGDDFITFCHFHIPIGS